MIGASKHGRTFFIMSESDFLFGDNPSPSSAAAQAETRHHEFDTQYDGFFDWLFNTGRENLRNQASIMDYQQWLDEYNYKNFDSPAARMKALQEAGVSRHLAAQSIAGNSSQTTGIDNPAAPSVPSGESPIGQMSNIASTVAGVSSTLGMLPFQQELAKSEVVTNLQKAGVDYWTARSLEVQLPNLTWQQQADIFNKLANADVLAQEAKYLKDTYDYRIEQLKLELSTAASEADKAQYQAQIEQLNLQYQQEFDKWCIDNGFDRKVPYQNAILMSFLRGKFSASAIGEAVELWNYRSSKGSYLADSDTAYIRAYNQMEGSMKAQCDNVYNVEMEKLKADKDSQLMYGNRLAILEANRERIVGMASIYMKNVEGVNGFIGWFLQALIKAPVDVFNQFTNSGLSLEGSGSK